MIAELAIATIIATHYAQKPVTLTCVQFGRNDPTLGSVPAGGNEIDLAAKVCRALRRPAHSAPFAEAVITIIHEALHAKGDTNEPRVECEAASRTSAALYRWFGLANMQAHVRAVTYQSRCVR